MIASERKGGRRPETQEPTGRQMEILRHLGLGLTEVEIAAKLGRSTTIVESEMRCVFEFFKTRDRTQAVVKALDQGLLDLSAFVQGVDLSIFSGLHPKEQELLWTMHAAYQAGEAPTSGDLANTLGKSSKTVENQLVRIYSILRDLGIIDINCKRPKTRVVVLYLAYQQNPPPPLSRDYY